MICNHLYYPFSVLYFVLCLSFVLHISSPILYVMHHWGLKVLEIKKENTSARSFRILWFGEREAATMKKKRRGGGERSCRNILGGYMSHTLVREWGTVAINRLAAFFGRRPFGFSVTMFTRLTLKKNNNEADIFFVA